MSSASIQTVKGPVAVESLGLILPHEHLFTDLRGPATPDYAQGDPEDVVRVIMPNLEAAKAAGATALVECSTVGVGRNVRILKRLADATPVHIIAPTGVYRDTFVPATLRDLSAEAIVGGSGDRASRIVAAWIDQRHLDLVQPLR